MYSAAGNLDGSIRAMDTVSAILRPLPDELNTPIPYINAGKFYRMRGESLTTKGPDGSPVQTPESRGWYQKAVEVLMRGEKIQVAVNDRNRHLDGSHGKTHVPQRWFQLHQELGRSYVRLSELSKAAAAFEQAGRVRPLPELMEELANTQVLMGDRHKAAVSLLEGLVLEPANKRIASQVIEMYKQIDPQGCAIQYTSGPNLNLGCPLVHGDICSAFENMSGILLEGKQDAVAARVRRSAIADFKCTADRFAE